MPFSTESFLADVDAVYGKLGRCQIAVSEGIRDEAGAEIGPKLMRGPGEVDAHGNVQLSGSGALGDGLADLVKRELTPQGGKAPRVRADTFGYHPALLAASLADRRRGGPRRRPLRRGARGARRRLSLGDPAPGEQRP